MEKGKNIGGITGQGDSMSAQAIFTDRKPTRSKYSLQEFIELKASETQQVLDETRHAQHLGVAMFLLGVGLWYFKLQRRQDQLTRKQG
jgi:hypothetical protein